MLLLATAALPTTRAWRAGVGLEWRAGTAGECLGRLLTPRHYSAAAETAAAGIPWAADNDGYNGVDVPALERMLAAIAGVPDGLFVASPDVFGDGDATLERLEEWAPRIRAGGHPAALVTQPGITRARVPWHLTDAVFVGAPDAWRQGPEVLELVAEAKRRRLHVHVGRVNSIRRIAWAAEIGADSVDGTKWARWRRTHLPVALAATRNAGAARPLALDVDVRHR